MNMPKETQWLCEHAKQLEQYAGQWVMFSEKDGLVCKAETFQKLQSVSKRQKSSADPFIFHVPSKDELGSPLPVMRHA